MQPCNRNYYSKIYWRLNMFLAAYRSSSEALNCICSLWFIYPCGDRPLSRLGGKWHTGTVSTQPVQLLVTTWVYKPEAANTVWGSWWWAVCRSKHVEPSINFGIIISITRLHLVGYFWWFILRCTDPWILDFSLWVSSFEPEDCGPKSFWLLTIGLRDSDFQAACESDSEARRV
jgi:hypothetical protein